MIRTCALCARWARENKPATSRRRPGWRELFLKSVVEVRTLAAAAQVLTHARYVSFSPACVVSETSRGSCRLGPRPLETRHYSPRPFLHTGTAKNHLRASRTLASTSVGVCVVGAVGGLVDVPENDGCVNCGATSTRALRSMPAWMSRRTVRAIERPRARALHSGGRADRRGHTFGDPPGAHPDRSGW